MRYEIYIQCEQKPKPFYLDAIREYEKRLGPFCKITCKFFKKQKEWDKLLRELKIDLEESGGQITAHRIIPGISEMGSEDLARKMAAWENRGQKKVIFLVAGDNGTESCPVGEKLSLSCFDMDPPMTGMILTEQIYRGYRILNNQPYHK